MDILQTGAQLLEEKLGVKADLSTITEALSGLLGGGEGGFDISSLVKGLMENNNLQSMVTSWLGDGPNKGIDPNSVMQFFGSEKISTFASQIGVQSQEAAQGLASVIPQMIDKASSGGSILESAGGGLGGILEMGKGLFK